MASRVAADQDRGRPVTGSMNVPTMHIPSRSPRRPRPGARSAPRAGPIAVAVTAATGIGHGAATAAPPPSQQPGRHRQRDAHTQRLAGKLIADRHHAAQRGGTREGERRAQQRAILIRPHSVPPLHVQAGPQASGHPPQPRRMTAPPSAASTIGRGSAQSASLKASTVLRAAARSDGSLATVDAAACVGAQRRSHPYPFADQDRSGSRAGCRPRTVAAEPGEASGTGPSGTFPSL
jgi:hypothetical protein